MAHLHCDSCSHEHDAHAHHHEHEHHHSHEHEHHHEEHSLKSQLWLIGITVVLLVIAVLIERGSGLSKWQLLLVYLVPYLIIGHDTLKEAAEGIAHGDAFNEHFLMSIATIGALCIGFLPGAETEFPEVSPDAVRVGETIVIRPGEKVPLDGLVIEGTSALNTVALTGESLPRDITVGDEVISGCVNISGVVKVRTTKAFGESTVSKIISLVENAQFGGERRRA